MSDKQLGITMNYSDELQRIIKLWIRRNYSYELQRILVTNHNEVCSNELQ